MSAWFQLPNTVFNSFSFKTVQHFVFMCIYYNLLTYIFFLIFPAERVCSSCRAAFGWIWDSGLPTARGGSTIRTQRTVWRQQEEEKEQRVPQKAPAATKVRTFSSWILRLYLVNSDTWFNNALLNQHILCVAVNMSDTFVIYDFRQLDWRPEKAGEARKRHEKVLIIQNMFHPSDFEVRVNLRTTDTPRRNTWTYCRCYWIEEHFLGNTLHCMPSAWKSTSCFLTELFASADLQNFFLQLSISTALHWYSRCVKLITEIVLISNSLELWHCLVSL